MEANSAPDPIDAATDDWFGAGEDAGSGDQSPEGGQPPGGATDGDADGSGTPDGATPELFEVEHDGQKLNVDLSTLQVPVKVNGEESLVAFNDLRNGFMKDADYTQKTSELAEQRKALAAEREEFDKRVGEERAKAEAKPEGFDDWPDEAKQTWQDNQDMRAKAEESQRAAEESKVEAEKERVKTAFEARAKDNPFFEKGAIGHSIAAHALVAGRDFSPEGVEKALALAETAHEAIGRAAVEAYVAKVRSANEGQPSDIKGKGQKGSTPAPQPKPKSKNDFSAFEAADRKAMADWGVE